MFKNMTMIFILKLTLISIIKNLPSNTRLQKNIYDKRLNIRNNIKRWLFFLIIIIDASCQKNNLKVKKIPNYCQEKYPCDTKFLDPPQI